MFVRRIWRFFFFLVVAAGLVLGGIALYRLGFSQGALTNLTLPEGAEAPLVPYGRVPFGWYAWPHFGLLGFFPLLCLGGFFFLMAMSLFGFFGRRRAWMGYGPGAHRHWKQYGPPPWGPEEPRGSGDPPKAQADDSPPDEGESEA